MLEALAPASPAQPSLLHAAGPVALPDM